MIRRLAIALILLLSSSALAPAQGDQSLADAAKEGERRLQSATTPATVYTISPSGLPVASCPLEQLPPDNSNPANSYVVQRCADGDEASIRTNARTGVKWMTSYHRDGSMSGIDRCGYKWTFSARTLEYPNENGDRRTGEGTLREMEGPATTCGAGARPADMAATNQSPCRKDTYRNPVTGDTTTTERCPDGTIKIQGWNRNLTWQETYLGDRSSFGIDACGVQSS